jgi:hypothetical protein
MAISDFTKLAQQTQASAPPKPSSFTEMASSTVPAKKAAAPKGLVKTLAPELVKKGVKAAGDYLAKEAELDRNRSFGDRFITTFVEKPAQILKFASVDLPRYTLGGFASVGKAVMEATLSPVFGKDYVRRSFTPDTQEAMRLNELVFKDKNPMSYQQIKEQVDAYVAGSEDATPWEKANLGTTIAVLGFAADAIPGKPSAGNLSKKLLKELAKDLDEVSIVTKLKAADIPEAVATRAAKQIAEAKTPSAVNRAMQFATKETLDEVADLRTKGASAVSESIPAPLRPLANEARRYDSADDFIKAIEKNGNIDGTVPRWGTRNQYLADTPKNAAGGIDEAGERFELAKLLEDKPAFLNGALPEAELRKFADDNDLVYLEANGREVVAKTQDEAMRVIDAKNQRELGLALGYEDLGAAMSKKDLKEFYEKATGGMEITGSPQALGGSETLSAPTPIGKPRTTAGTILRDQSGETPDPVQVERAFAGEYTAGDGVSRTFDEVAEDVMTTTAEPVLAARTIKAMQTAKTNILEYVQNTEERLRKLQEDPSLRIDDNSNPYQQMTLMPGRVGAQIEDVQDRLRTVFKDMNDVAKSGGRKLEDMRNDVNDFLWLRHAPERNASLGDGAAGIKTDEAIKRMDALKASPQYTDIVRLGDDLARMNRESLGLLLDSGVIKPELYDTLTTKYKNYVPLNRIMDTTSDISGSLSGRGFDVKSTGIRRAKGSSRDVSDIVENTILNYEQAVIRAEKNIVDRATLQFVQENEKALDGLMKVRRPRGLETTDDPQILQLFEEGKRVWIKIEDPHLAIAMKGTGRQQLPHIFYPVAAFTRLMSGLATRFNPEFAFTNIVRDIQERTVFLSAQKGVGGKEAFKAAGRDPASIKAVTDFVLGRETADAALYKEMKMLGGTTGGMGLSTRKKAQLNIRHLERAATSSSPIQYGRKALEYIDNWNTVFEDATRLTTYKTALANGLSKRQAAALAKEATVNFNRMGKGGPVINGMYMFANASIQGSVKTIRAMKNPKVLAGLTVTIGTAVTAVNEWNDSVDPEWRKKVSKWDVINSLPIVLPSDDGTFRTFAIPVAYGIKPMRVAADYAYRLANDEDVSALDMTDGVLSSIMESYNPVGGTDMMSAATPTILDLPLEIVRNKKWSGSVIKPDFDPYSPESTKYFDNLEDKTSGKIAISLTEKLAGWGVEVSPADLVYAFESYISGAGRSAERFFEIGVSVATEGELPPISDFPFISRFYKAKAEDEIFNTQSQSNLKELLTEDRRERFYLGKKADAAWDSIAELPSEEKKQKLKELAASDPELFDKVADIAEAEKIGLVGEERQLKRAAVSVRASYIAGELKTLKTKEERRALLQNYIDKKIATNAVLDAIETLQAESK